VNRRVAASSGAVRSSSSSSSFSNSDSLTQLGTDANTIFTFNSVNYSSSAVRTSCAIAGRQAAHIKGSPLALAHASPNP
jgi:hypothetical protein